jgi:YD repeat-containing protein
MACEETSVRFRACKRSRCALLQRLVLAGMAFILNAGLLHAQPIQYFYDDLGRRIKVIDPTGNVAEYVYDAVGNILEIKRSTLTGLGLLNFTPSRGPVGTQVTLQGRGFGATPSGNTVTFNGTAATVLAATSTQVVVTVPPGATTGPIAVTVAGNTATSDRQFVVPQTPVITAITPSVALAGSVMPNFQVQGRNLDGAMFTFTSLNSLVTITSTTIDPTGTSALLTVTVRANTAGTAVVVATSASFVRSDATSTTANTLHILNGSTDDDGDGLTNRRYAGVETRIKTGRDSRVGGKTLCLSHCGYTSGLCCMLPTSRPVRLWRTRLTASPTIG